MVDALNEVLSAKWRDLRGLEIVSFGVSSVKANEDDEKMMKEMQRNAAYMDPTRAAAAMVGAQAAAMQTAAANQGGAAIGFMGMNMAANAGGVNAGNLFQMGQQQAQAAAAQAQAAAPAGETWKCACGATVTGKFCPECGAKKPEAPVGWTCPSCGAVNKGRFCSECGAKKPEGVPQYKCDKCGWEPADPTHPPKFCPECGDPFDDGDLK
jgi:membrane protease subunit (stomatin/prohibitin family)